MQCSAHAQEQVIDHSGTLALVNINILRQWCIGNTGISGIPRYRYAVDIELLAKQAR